MPDHDDPLGHRLWASRILVRIHCHQPSNALRLHLEYPRYGFPNDLLAKLAGKNARVLDRPVSPIYGDEHSELKVLHVMGPILESFFGQGRSDTAGDELKRDWP